MSIFICLSAWKKKSQTDCKQMCQSHARYAMSSAFFRINYIHAFHPTQWFHLISQSQNIRFCFSVFLIWYKLSLAHDFVVMWIDCGLFLLLCLLSWFESHISISWRPIKGERARMENIQTKERRKKKLQKQRQQHHHTQTHSVFFFSLLHAI